MRRRTGGSESLGTSGRAQFTVINGGQQAQRNDLASLVWLQTPRALNSTHFLHRVSRLTDIPAYFVDLPFVNMSRDLLISLLAF